MLGKQGSIVGSYVSAHNIITIVLRANMNTKTQSILNHVRPENLKCIANGLQYVMR